MDAGQAGLAVLGDVYRFALLELHGAGGADLSADAAANAGIRDPDKSGAGPPFGICRMRLRNC